MSRGWAAALAAILAGALLALPGVWIVFGLPRDEGVLGTLVIGGACLVAPGIAGMLLPGRRDAPGLFTRGLAFTAALILVAFAWLKLGGTAPTPHTLAALLGFGAAVAGGIGAARGRGLWRRDVPGRIRRDSVLGGLAAVGTTVAALLLAIFAGTVVVPPLEDQDMEVQGTAWGIAHDLQPVCLTNRSTLHFFAHPPLLHLLNAATLTVAGQLETVRPAYDLALRERSREDTRHDRRGFAAVQRAFAGELRRPDRYVLWEREVYGSFERTPALFGTRVPNFVLAAAVAALLFGWLRRLGVGAGDGALVVVVYATLPEIFVRSGYGGYYALTAATLTAGAWLAAGTGGGGRSGLAAGALANLANQKALILGVGAAGYRLLARQVARRGGLAAMWPLLLGLAAGGAAFWLYGLAVAPEEFVADHLIEHGVGRFATDEGGRSLGRLAYPSRLGVWVEFANHQGWLWTALAGFGLLAGLAASLRREEPAGRVASLRISSLGIAALWVLVGIILFTATDWRQTKHLCLLAPALTFLIGALFPAAGPRARHLLRGALVLSLGWNVVWIVRLAQDFQSLPMSTIW